MKAMERCLVGSLQSGLSIRTLHLSGRQGAWGGEAES